MKNKNKVRSAKQKKTVPVNCLSQQLPICQRGAIMRGTTSQVGAFHLVASADTPGTTRSAVQHSTNSWTVGVARENQPNQQATPPGNRTELRPCGQTGDHHCHQDCHAYQRQNYHEQQTCQIVWQLFNKNITLTLTK